MLRGLRVTIVCCLVIGVAPGRMNAAGEYGNGYSCPDDAPALVKPVAAAIGVGIATALNTAISSAFVGIVAPLRALVLRGKKLSPEVEQVARKTLHEMGVKNADSVHLRQSGWLGRKLIGKTKACAIGGPSVVSRHIIIGSEKWFNKLSEREKRFLIGHEGAHLNRCHEIKIAASKACAESIACVAFRFLQGKLASAYREGKVSKDLFEAGFIAAGSSFAIGIFFGVKPFVSRLCGKQADCDAAEKLHNAAGGKALMQTLKKHKEKRQAKRAKKLFGLVGLWDRLNDALDFPLLSTQPPLDRRIAYLGKMAEEQAQAARG